MKLKEAPWKKSYDQSRQHIKKQRHYFASMWDKCKCAVVWTFLKRWEYQTTLPAFREICMKVKKQQLELDMAQWTVSKLRKENIKAIYHHPAYLTYMHKTSWEMPGWWITSWNQDFWEKCQKPQICRWHHTYGRKWRGTKEPLDESEREEWKAGLKYNIQKTKIMTFSPITSWQIDGETVTDFIFLGSKITVDGDWSHEIKRRLFLGSKAVTYLDSVLKSWDLSQQRSI